MSRTDDSLDCFESCHERGFRRPLGGGPRVHAVTYTAATFADLGGHDDALRDAVRPGPPR